MVSGEGKEGEIDDERSMMEAFALFDKNGKLFMKEFGNFISCERSEVRRQYYFYWLKLDRCICYFQFLSI